MANKWIQFVKYFAKQKGISYIKAMTDEDIKADYKAWKAGDIEYITPKPKAKKVVEEEEFEYIIPAPKKPKAKYNSVEIVLKGNTMKENNENDKKLGKLAMSWWNKIEGKKPEDDVWRQFIGRLPLKYYNDDDNVYFAITPKKINTDLFAQAFINANKTEYLTSFGSDNEYYNYEGATKMILDFLKFAEQKDIIKLNYLYSQEIDNIIKSIGKEPETKEEPEPEPEPKPEPEPEIDYKLHSKKLSKRWKNVTIESNQGITLLLTRSPESDKNGFYWWAQIKEFKLPTLIGLSQEKNGSDFEYLGDNWYGFNNFYSTGIKTSSLLNHYDKIEKYIDNKMAKADTIEKEKELANKYNIQTLFKKFES